MTAATYTYEECPQRADVTMLGEAGPKYVCGCGRCPQPDPTPAQLHAAVDRAWLAGHRWLGSAES